MGDVALGFGNQLATAAYVLGRREEGILGADPVQGVGDQGAVRAGDELDPQPPSLEQAANSRPWRRQEDEEG